MVWIRKILKWILTIGGSILIGAIIATFIYRDRIIDEVVKELNRYIDTPIAVRKIDFNIWEDFPTTSLTFYDITISGSIPDADLPFAEAKKVIITLDPLELLRKHYVINAATIENASIYIHIEANGRNNYSIVKRVGADSTQNKVIDFSLNKIIVKDVHTKIVDQTQKLEQSFNSGKNVFTLNRTGDIYELFSHGDILIEHIKLEDRLLVNNTQTDVNGKLLIHPGEQLKIERGTIDVHNSVLDVTGSIGLGEVRNLDIQVSSADSRLSKLTGLLPDKTREAIQQYKINGEADFAISLKGRVSKNHSPRLEASYKVTNGTLVHNESKIQITDLNASGQLTVPKIRNISGASIEFENFHSKMNGEDLKGSFTLTNLKNPRLAGDFEGTIELGIVKPFINSESVQDLGGQLTGSLSIETKVDQLKAGDFIASGSFDLKDVFVDHLSLSETLRVPAGSLIFSNQKLVLKNSTVSLGANTLEVNGTLNNLFETIYSDAPMDLTASVKGEQLDVNNLIDLFSRDGPEESTNSQFKQFAASLSVDLKKVRYDRFTGHRMKGRINLKDQKAIVRDLTFEAGGGSFDLNGLLDTSNGLNVTARGKVKDLYIDSLFYVFHNFNQSWLVEENLEGQITADILTEIAFDRNLKFIPSSLTADADASIRNGELNNFQPMIDLGKYIKDDNLDQLKFSDIVNSIHIEDEIIYLPEMIVRSNVTDIRISGTHGFDRSVDYRLIIPLSTLTGYKNEDAFGAVEDDGKGSKLHLKITGTTDDYKIQYDKESVKKKIVADLKGEVQELKEAFKKKERKKAEAIELNEDEFIEWEEDSVGSNIQYRIENKEL